MDLSLFDYPFPKELIAQHPLPSRDDSRMMVIDRKRGTWNHRRFPDLPEYLREGDLLVLNNAEADLVPLMGGAGQAPPLLVPPLPPYIKRKRGTDFTEEDYQRYRTVYAAVPGSKAAPTAGFHFTEEILEKIRSLGIETRFLTLHVSYDTYKPIRCQDIREHPMHGEEYILPPETAEAVARAKQEGRRVIAVGTTVVRALESWNCYIAPSACNQDLPGSPSYIKRGISPAPHSTTLYITPGYRFQIVDALLTNFHRPRSTVLVMVSAFVSAVAESEGGRRLLLNAYADAIDKKYRLFSYGDCMLIL